MNIPASENSFSFSPSLPDRVSEERFWGALSAFHLPYTLLKAERYGKGHINDTYCLTCQKADGQAVRYILQGLSREAFPEPEKVMGNFIRVTDHLRKKILDRGGNPARETLSLIPAGNGDPYIKDGTGQVWRLMPFIENTFSESQASEALFETDGRAFGRFLKQMADYPAESLYETIPHFHDTPARFRRFTEVLKQDPMGRASSAAPEIEFVLNRESNCSVLADAQQAGLLPLRITHNDTKLDNILFDRESGEGICLVDLDTVMPGLAVCDFGDSIRSGAKHCAEDERDPERAVLDLALFTSYTRGFLQGSEDLLTQAEIAYLPWGARLMTLECGIRFLTDYLEGDRYFRTSRPGQNLDRCRVQFKLVSDIEMHFPRLESIVRSLAY